MGGNAVMKATAMIARAALAAGLVWGAWLVAPGSAGAHRGGIIEESDLPEPSMHYDDSGDRSARDSDRDLRDSDADAHDSDVGDVEARDSAADVDDSDAATRDRYGDLRDEDRDYAKPDRDLEPERDLGERDVRGRDLAQGAGPGGRVEDSLEQAGEATHRGLEHGAEPVGAGLERAMRATGRGLRAAIDGTGEFLRRAGNALTGRDDE